MMDWLIDYLLFNGSVEASDWPFIYKSPTQEPQRYKCTPANGNIADGNISVGSFNIRVGIMINVPRAIRQHNQIPRAPFSNQPNHAKEAEGGGGQE